jgi:hypothetical protein
MPTWLRDGRARLQMRTRDAMFHGGGWCGGTGERAPDVVGVLDLAQVGDQRVGVAADVHHRGEVLQQLHRLVVQTSPVSQTAQHKAVRRFMAEAV